MITKIVKSQRVLFLLLGLICIITLLNCTDKKPYTLVVKQFVSDKVPGYPDLPPNTRNVYVILPPGYNDSRNADKKYPTVYLLHGAGTGRNDIEKLAKTFHKTINILKSQFGKMITVIPHVGSSLCGDPDKFECATFYTNSEVNGDFRDYIVKDLVSFIDATFRTLDNPSKRALTGFSMGAYGAITLAMKSAIEADGNSPFTSVACHSGPLSLRQGFSDFKQLALDPSPSIGESLSRWYHYNITFPAIERAFCPGQTLNIRVENGELKYNEDVYNYILEHHDPITYLTNHPNALNNIKIFIDCGIYDELKLLQHARDFKQKLLDLGIPLDYYDEWEAGEELGWTLPEWFSGHYTINYRVGESLKFHSKHFYH